MKAVRETLSQEERETALLKSKVNALMTGATRKPETGLQHPL